VKIVFISGYFPLDLEQCVHGVYKRMGTFIEAMKTACVLDMLFYVPSGLAPSTEFKESMERSLSRHWNAELRLHLCRRAPVASSRVRSAGYLNSGFSILQNPPYSEIAGIEQVDFIKELLSGNPDMLFVHRLEAMIAVVLSEVRHPRIYFDLDDIEHVSFARSIRQPPWWRSKWFHFLRLPSLRLWEERAIRRSSTTFVCSERDRRYLKRVWRHQNVVCIPNCIEIPAAEEIPERPVMMFIGSFSYAPNAGAADFLIKSVWPRVLGAVPDAKLLIAGANPEKIPSFKDRPGRVEFLGFVEDLDKLYKEVKVVCCPVLAGGGTRIKILEAAAYGKPVVSTVLGAEGLNLRNDRDILIRNDPPLFSEACVQLLKHTELARRVGLSGRSVVMKEYDRKAVVGLIQSQLNLYGAAKEQ
jgi:glycosyltransferase involved in cell wall biosynthesis